MPDTNITTRDYTQRVPLCACVALASCVTTKLTERGSLVRVTSNQEVVRGCRYVSEVRAQDRMNGGSFGQDAAEENTYNRLKNSAAAMDADTVLLSRADTSVYGSAARGEAYSCNTR